MSRTSFKAVILLSFLMIAQSGLARDWFGGGNGGRWSNFGGFSNNADCNDWPEWTPMYWMEEMSGNNDNCYSQGTYASRYPYYPSYGAGGYAISPYQYAGVGIPSYGFNPYATYSRGFPQSRINQVYQAKKSRVSPLGNRGLTGFSRFGGNNITNPFSSFSNTSSPFSSFGSASPWGAYPLPMGYGGMPSMGSALPLSPMGGFGSGAMGMPGLSPLGGFGGSPFSPFSPFR